MEFWNQKLLRDCRSDADEVRQLTDLGWHVIVVWECELRKPEHATGLSRLYEQITGKKEPPTTPQTPNDA